ncbi:MAG: hypothetical protein IT378_21110 [Sandaracinaceae bacterium]|nr:hypothetical protein [Sandaracinaceae bacterium]
MPQTSELQDWGKVLDRLPFVGTLKRDVLSLRHLVYDRRPVRLLAVGRSGSGRSSILNALLAADALTGERERWVHVDASGRRADWLEVDDAPEPSELAARSLEENAPDLLIAVVAAGDEEDAAPRAAAALAALRTAVRQHHERADPKVVAVLTKRDALSTAESIDLAKRRVAQALSLAPEDVHAVAVGPGDRAGVDALAEALMAKAPEAAQLEIARAFEVSADARRALARTLVTSVSAIAATIGLAPIPFADAFILLPLQAAMVSAIAYVSGRPWDKRIALEWLGSVGVAGGAGMGLRWGAQQLVKLFPAGGSLVSAGVAGAGTLALGRSAIAYLIDGPGRLQHRLELRADVPA